MTRTKSCCVCNDIFAEVVLTKFSVRPNKYAHICRGCEVIVKSIENKSDWQYEYPSKTSFEPYDPKDFPHYDIKAAMTIIPLEPFRFKIVRSAK